MVRDAASTAQKLRGEEGSLVKVAYVRDGKESTADISSGRAAVHGATRSVDDPHQGVPAGHGHKSQGKRRQGVRTPDLGSTGQPRGSLEGGVETARLFLPKGQNYHSNCGERPALRLRRCGRWGVFWEEAHGAGEQADGLRRGSVDSSFEDNKAASVVGADARTYGAA